MTDLLSEQAVELESALTFIKTNLHPSLQAIYNEDPIERNPNKTYVEGVYNLDDTYGSTCRFMTSYTINTLFTNAMSRYSMKWFRVTGKYLDDNSIDILAECEIRMGDEHLEFLFSPRLPILQRRFKEWYYKPDSPGGKRVIAELLKTANNFTVT